MLNSVSPASLFCFAFVEMHLIVLNCFKGSKCPTQLHIYYAVCISYYGWRLMCEGSLDTTFPPFSGA